jgi:hypothetical protein
MSNSETTQMIPTSEWSTSCGLLILWTIILNQNQQTSRAWWYTPVSPALRRLRQEDFKLKASPSYIWRAFIKKDKKVNKLLIIITNECVLWLH